MNWFAERAGLEGTVAVFTGGAGGLGRAISKDFAANGVRVAVLDLDQAAVDALGGELGDALVRQGDARDPGVLQAFFDETGERWGRLDTLVNIVGGTFRAAFTDTNPKGWDTLLRTNLLHVLHACSLAVPRMRGGGSIINITTIEAHRAAPGFAVYSAAKAAVEQFARSLAVEVARDGIRVNNIAPDYVPTPAMTRFGRPAAEPAAVRATIPMGRAGVPADVSGCAVFLASALSGFLTGTTLHPDGGTFASSGWTNWPGSGWSTQPPAGLLNGR
ncbi:SDR family oxidoreductase [Amycolatopsis acidicola]|uniref:SDR family oxidoreductase n=1 Tax=Amycolatopsis acidicola TaxID=2596893 RepID=A0A5N0UYR0_9PSEU|nr:SDR family oxidoreductase [Amycolatopsis acidicola]KAA9156230.1 SDR family oxidoreductase [Amycolatopsis acidicola]